MFLFKKSIKINENIRLHYERCHRAEPYLVIDQNGINTVQSVAGLINMEWSQISRKEHVVESMLNHSDGNSQGLVL